MGGQVVTIIGGIILFLIAIALLRRGMKIVSTLISIVLLLLVALGVLMFMGIVPIPSQWSG